VARPLDSVISLEEFLHIDLIELVLGSRMGKTILSSLELVTTTLWITFKEVEKQRPDINFTMHWNKGNGLWKPVT
jgi:hypothetical protein